MLKWTEGAKMLCEIMQVEEQPLHMVKLDVLVCDTTETPRTWSFPDQALS